MKHPITFEFEINSFFSLKKYVPNVAWMKYSEMSAVVKVPAFQLILDVTDT